MAAAWRGLGRSQLNTSSHPNLSSPARACSSLRTTRSRTARREARIHSSAARLAQPTRHVRGAGTVLPRPCLHDAGRGQRSRPPPREGQSLCLALLARTQMLGCAGISTGSGARRAMRVVANRSAPPAPGVAYLGSARPPAMATGRPILQHGAGRRRWIAMLFGRDVPPPAWAR
jgi:hypothetical protein